MTWRHGWVLGCWWLAVASPLAAQEWDAVEAQALRRLGEQHRTGESGAAARGWRGTAVGVIRWSMQLAPDDLVQPPRPLTIDTVRLEVYGRGAGRSKQILRAWQRGRTLPADITYHRDHLGIVTDGFGATIRLGDGDEVRDVLHPLAPGADSLYETAIGDSLAVLGPDGPLRLRQLRVRPRGAGRSGVIGVLYLDIASGALVRFDFAFTPSAYRDATVEDITVQLEQSRAEAGVWLPFRQSLEIRRRARNVDLAVRTIIRADWRISADLDDTLPDSLFAGDRITGPRRPSVVADVASMPFSADDGTRLRSEIARAVGTRIADARRGARFRTRGAASLVTFDRVQGPAFGAGIGVPVGGQVRLDLDAGLGIGSAMPTGGVQLHGPLGRGVWQFVAERRVRDVADQPVISPALNALRSLISADDAGDWARVSRVSLAWRLGRAFGVSMALEDADALRTTAASLGGAFRPNPALGTRTFGVLRLDATRQGFFVGLEGGAGADATYGRVDLRGTASRRFGPGQMQLHAALGVASRGTPARRGYVLGGRGTLVGERFRAFDGFGMALVRATWLTDLRVPELRLRGPVTTGPTVRLGPFVGAGAAWREVLPLAGAASGGVRPVAGLVVVPLWGIVRIEVAVPLRGLHAGRPGLVLDIHPDWWPLL